MIRAVYIALVIVRSGGRGWPVVTRPAEAAPDLRPPLDGGLTTGDGLPTTDEKW